MQSVGQTVMSSHSLEAPLSRKRYLKPSVLWGIRQEFPRWLGMLLATIALVVPLLLWTLVDHGVNRLPIKNLIPYPYKST